MSEQEPQKAGSPVLGSRFLKQLAAEGEATFTTVGAVNKTGLLTVIVVAFAALAWATPFDAMPALIPGLLINLVLALVISFVPNTAPWLAIPYAISEGLLVGVISLTYEWRYPGIVFQAAAGTMGVLAIMTAGYASGLLKFGARGRSVIIACTLGLALTYLVSLLASLFGHRVGFIHDAGPWGIAFSLFALVIAALNFSLDFEFMQASQERGLSKKMEWYAAFGVLVTLVWVYFEMLRLLSKLRKK